MEVKRTTEEISTQTSLRENRKLLPKWHDFRDIRKVCCGNNPFFFPGWWMPAFLPLERCSVWNMNILGKIILQTLLECKLCEESSQMLHWNTENTWNIWIHIKLSSSTYLKLNKPSFFHKWFRFLACLCMTLAMVSSKSSSSSMTILNLSFILSSWQYTNNNSYHLIISHEPDAKPGATATWTVRLQGQGAWAEILPPPLSNLLTTSLAYR